MVTTTVGKLITFEGGEGAGKSTQVALLYDAIDQAGYAVLQTREPGGADGAEQIRELLVKSDSTNWNSISELLLFNAARREHYLHVVEPALKEGTIVLCDRFFDSTVAYQVYGNGLDPKMVKQLHQYVVGGLEPHLTFMMMLDAKTGIDRTKKRDDKENRFEQKGSDYHRRVEDGFRNIAKDNPNRCSVIDASQSMEIIHGQMIDVVNQKFGLTLSMPKQA